MRTKTEYRKSEASRQQIVDAAIATLAKRGLAATSVGDIAAAAKMAKGVVHYHFKGKNDLLAKVLGECQRRLSVDVQTAWAEDGPPIDKIRRVLKEMWRARTQGSPEIRVMIDLMAFAVHDAHLHRSVAEMFHVMRSGIIVDFVKAFDAIGLRPRVPAQIIPKLVMAVLDGVGLHAIFDPPSEADQEDMLRAIEVAAFALFEL
jgi:AcrR family transcriptional regulator